MYVQHLANAISKQSGRTRLNFQIWISTTTRPRCEIPQRWRRLCSRGILRCYSEPLVSQALFCNALISRSEGGPKRPECGSAPGWLTTKRASLLFAEVVEFEPSELVDGRIERDRKQTFLTGIKLDLFNHLKHCEIIRCAVKNDPIWLDWSKNWVISALCASAQAKVSHWLTEGD